MEAKAGGSLRVQRQFALHDEFQASLGYQVKPQSQRQKKKIETKPKSKLKHFLSLGLVTLGKRYSPTLVAFL